MNPRIPTVPYRVLVVEDEEAVLTMLRIFVKTKCPNAEVEFATTVSEAQAMLESFKFDLVISDYDLPGGKGHVVLQKAAESSPEAIRVFASGREAIPAQYVDLAHATFMKPWNPVVFAKFVNGGFLEKRAPAA